MSEIKDIKLAPSGHDKINWVASYMPILNYIKADFEKRQPFAGMKISMSIHLEAKTAYLAKLLAAGGAGQLRSSVSHRLYRSRVAAAQR